MVLTTGRFFEVAKEIYLEWYLNSWPVNFVQTLLPTYFNWHSEQTFYSYSNFMICSVSHFLSVFCLRQLPCLFWLKFVLGNHVSVAEWAHTWGIHHWEVLWRWYRKLAWVGSEPTTTEFCWDALSYWTTSPWVQLGLRANFVHYSNFIVFSVSHFDSAVCFCQSPRLL